ncbi:acyl-CoA dehydrogenase family protein, partial [Thermodesulfobacteriota bacterium]
IIPKSLWRKMGQQGFLCTSVPEAYGGIGGDFLYSVIMGEELVRSRQFGVAAPLHSDVVVPYIEAYATEELKRKYLPSCVSGDIITAVAMTEPNTGSDLAAIQTTAVEDGDHVVITGQKTFISSGILCDMVVMAVKNPSAESPHKAIDLYLVEADTPGFEKGKNLEKMGWHCQDTAELFFNECRVPKINRLGTKGGGFIMLMEKLQQERLVTSIGAQVHAEVMLETTIEYCRKHKDYGRPISKFDYNQLKIVDMATEVKLGRVFLEKLIADHMEGKDIVAEVSMAKFWCTEMAQRVADGCMELHGANGICETFSIGRAWRDTRVMPIFAGTNEIMRGIIGKSMGL